MVSTPRPKRRTPFKGRVCALYGPRGVGKTTLARVICDASNKDVALLDVDTLVDRLPGLSAYDVCFVEVDSDEEVSRLVESGHLSQATDGVLIKVVPDSWQVDDATWTERERAIDALAREHVVRLAGVMVQYREIEAACIGIARACNLKS